MEDIPETQQRQRLRRWPLLKPFYVSALAIMYRRLISTSQIYFEGCRMRNCANRYCSSFTCPVSLQKPTINLKTLGPYEVAMRHSAIFYRLKRPPKFLEA